MENKKVEEGVCAGKEVTSQYLNNQWFKKKQLLVFPLFLCPPSNPPHLSLPPPLSFLLCPFTFQ